MSEKVSTNLRQAENSVSIEGLLLEISKHEGTTSTGSKYLSARITIETGKNEQHQVEMFASEKKSDGTENGIYKSLQTVVEEYKTVQDVGREDADKVRVSANSGELRLNDYVNERGLNSFPQISATFINRVENEEDYNPHAEFEVELVVDRVLEEIDKDDNETGRATLHGYIPLYGGRVIPFEFKVVEDGAGYVLDNYEKGDTVSVHGSIINFFEKKEEIVEAAFGEDKKKVSYNVVREFLIRGGSEPYEDDSPSKYDTELIKKALNEREVYLEELKEKHKNKDKNKNTARKGFDTTESKKEVDISDDDLPF